MNTELIDTKPFSQPTRDRWLALATGIVACIIYALTVQRTVSFWDCGEFIASAVILGVPHPPGTPLFLLIGRLFSLLPVAEDISLRVNLVSVISGAGAVGLAYLVTARFLRRWFLKSFEFAGKEALIIASSFGGAMMLGFAATVWNNAVEAEVYGITLAIFMSIMYAVLVWIDVRYETLGPRLLIFATYMAVFGLGVHMMVYLAIPGMWLLVLMLRPDYRKDWRIYAGALAMMLVMATGTEAFLWNLVFLMGVAGWWLVAPVEQKRAIKGWIAPIWAVLLYIITMFTIPLAMFESYGWGTFDWLATLAIFGVTFVGSFMATSEEPTMSRRRWGLLGGIVAASLMAWSLQVIIPIRSHQDPRIDENNPETWDTFKGFLERKQYGQTSMVNRMFKRRGLWQNQFGRHPRMGFWGFFEEQFVVTGRPFFVLFFLGMLPFVVPFIRSGAQRESGFPDRFGVPLFLFVTLLATTVGLVAYMNFADGVFYDGRASDQAYLEVRDRDYFFTTGFALFGVCIALGVAWLTAFLANRMQGASRGLVAVAVVVLGLALPLGTVRANWVRCDRSKNFIPYDYALNILETCPPNSILFTNGDNDTFPVWCLQEAYGIRTDVKVVNLSLVNTDWYILQMKNQYKVPINLEDDQIRTIPTRLDDGRLYGKPIRPYQDVFRGYAHDLVPYMGPEGQLVRVQDQMVEQIVLANNWDVPVYFSGSYSGQTELDLAQHMEAVGQSYRLVRRTGTGMFDIAESDRLYNEVYRYTSFADLNSFQDESTASLLWAYPEKITQLAERHLATGDTTQALQTAHKAREVNPAYWRTYQFLARLYGAMGQSGDSTAVVDSGLADIEHLLDVNPTNVLYAQSYALVLDVAGRFDDALVFLSEEFRARPKEELLFITLAQYAVRAQDRPRIELAARLWLDGHPTDDRARQLLNLPPQNMPPPVLPQQGGTP